MNVTPEIHHADQIRYLYFDELLVNLIDIFILMCEINAREIPRGNQEWIIKRNWQHKTKDDDKQQKQNTEK